MELSEPKESKENKGKKENKKIKKSKLKEKESDKKSKKDKKNGKKKGKERKSILEFKNPNEIIFLNKKIKLLEGQLKDKKNNFINNNFDISLKNPIHTLNYHNEWVLCLTILNDGRLISGSDDNSIIIYNKTTYQPDLIINEHKSPINCIIQLNSGILATSSNDKKIKLFNIKGNNYNIIQTLEYHTDWVNQIIEIKNKYLVSCSSDKSIIFYLKDNNKYKKHYQISTNGLCFCINKIKENEICYSENDDKICFFDINERKIKSSISNISKSWNSPFIMISKDLLFISGKNKISIININYYELIREIKVPNSGWIYGACMLNKNILLTGDEKGIIREWKIEEDNLILISKKENAHNDCITSLLNIGNGHIASGSFDKSIKIWKI